LNVPELYLLDTNTVSYLLKDRSPAARSRWTHAEQTARVAISAITEAELRYGIHKNPLATRTRIAVELFFSIAEILPWDSAAAQAYGLLRHQLNSAGKVLSELDLLIAAHAVSLDAILVTADRAFQQASGLLRVVDWATDISKTL
jgi:tRNA(fMet)-specific endonuclease VapC